MALLAFEDTRSSPVADLMDISQRQKTASELNAAILSSQCQVMMRCMFPAACLRHLVCFWCFHSSADFVAHHASSGEGAAIARLAEAAALGPKPA